MTVFEAVPDRRRLGVQLVWFLLWVVATGVAAYLQPSRFGHGTHQELGFPPCPVVLLFDRPCPGCGMTTSWSAFVHGDFLASFHAHPFGPVTYLLFTFTALLGLYGFWKRLRIVTETRFVNWFSVAFGLAFLLFGIARMLTTTGYADQAEQLYFQANR